MSDKTETVEQNNQLNYKPEPLIDWQKDLLVLFGLLFLTLFLFLIKVDSVALLDPDEPRYAACAREMIETGNWIVPYFNGEQRLNKPPLFYWLIAMSFKSFGVSEFSARLPTLLFAIGGIILTFLWARRMWCRKKAFMAAFILVVSPLYICLSRLCITDMTMCFFLYLSLYLFYTAYEKGRIGTWNKLSLYFLMAMMFLTKGHVGILVFLLVVSLFLVLMKDIRYLGKLRSLSGVLLFAVLVLPWSIMFVSEVGIGTIADLISHETYGRVVHAHQHPEPLYFFSKVVLSGFYPWSIFLIMGVTFLFKWKTIGKCETSLNSKTSYNKKNNGLCSVNNSEFLRMRLKFFCSWFFAVLIFFSMSHSKLYSYMLPMAPTVPFLFIMIVANIEQTKKRINHFILLFIMLLLFTFSVLVLIYFPKWISDKNSMYHDNYSLLLWTLCICMGINLLIFFVKGINRGKYSLGFASYVILVIVTMNSNVLIGEKRSTRELVTDFLPPQTDNFALFSFSKIPTSLVYYSNKNVERINEHKPEEFEMIGERDDELYVFMRKRDYKRQLKAIDKFGFKVLGETDKGVILTTVKH